MKKIKKYIQLAGGASQVSRTLGLSRTTVWRWQNVGFPDTDFSGKTSHAKNLAQMCRKNGHEVKDSQVLSSGRP